MLGGDDRTVYKDDEGQIVVHPRHLLPSEDGSPNLLKSAEVGFALAEYSNGDNVDPVRLPYADQCHTKFLQREARQASASASTKKRRTPATASAQGRHPTTAKRPASTRAPSTRSLTQTLPA